MIDGVLPAMLDETLLFAAHSKMPVESVENRVI